jgi:hypothetical protein
MAKLARLIPHIPVSGNEAAMPTKTGPNCLPGAEPNEAINPAAPAAQRPFRKTGDLLASTIKPVSYAPPLNRPRKHTDEDVNVRIFAANGAPAQQQETTIDCSNAPL